MSHNSFGHLFRVTTWGESHGPAIGCVVDGCPPRIPLTEADIQPWLDRRRPGSSKFVTQRQEPDAVRILSGVFQDERTPEQVTTGTPIALLIENVDQRSKDYGDIAAKYRPGHADYVYDAKYGVRDYRGGGRASARETGPRPSIGSPRRLKTRPRVASPTGTVTGAPVSITVIPRARPSVLPKATQRTREPPSCCWTSPVSLTFTPLTSDSTRRAW